MYRGRRDVSEPKRRHRDLLIKCFLTWLRLNLPNWLEMFAEQSVRGVFVVDRDQFAYINKHVERM